MNELMPQGPQVEGGPGPQVGAGAQATPQAVPGAPLGTPSSAPSSAPPSPESLMSKYQKLMQAGETLSSVRVGLDKLSTLADTITQEDVIKEAGVLVAKGLTPTSVAGLLADMPENSEQLAQWVAKHDQDVTQREAQLEQVTNGIRHQLGVQAIHGLMLDHVREKLNAGL